MNLKKWLYGLKQRQYRGGRPSLGFCGYVFASIPRLSIPVNSAQPSNSRPASKFN